MRILRALLTVGAVAIGGNAFAGLIEDPWTTNVFMSTSGGGVAEVEHTHDISPPYVTGTPILDADLTLYFKDDASDSSEKAIVLAWGISSDQFEVDDGTKSFDLGLMGILDIVLTGDFTYKLKVTSGDFYFKGSKLSVLVDGPIGAVAVPEPGTLAIFGVGLLSLGFIGRFRRAR